MRKIIYFAIAVSLSCQACLNEKQEKTEVEKDFGLIVKEKLDFPIPVMIDTPNFSGQVLVSDSEDFITLQLESKKKNQIIDDENWFVSNRLSLPTFEIWDECGDIRGNLPANIPGTYYDFILTTGFNYDENNIFLYGQNFRRNRFLIITDRSSTQIEHFLDFKNFNYSPRAKKGDEEFIFQAIKWAIAEGDILYVSHSHPTYSRSSFGENAYLSAIDLNNYGIIWTSEPLTCNSTFIIIDNSIVCGYGFTAEPDYLFVIDKNSGEKKQIIKLEKAPSYIIHKDDKVYVRTYSFDYVFSIDQRTSDFL